MLSKKAFCSTATSLRNPYAIAEIGAPTMAASTSSFT